MAKCAGGDCMAAASAEPPRLPLGTEPRRSTAVPTLTELCGEAIAAHAIIDVRNAPDVLEFASRHGAAALRLKALRLITSCYEAVQDVHPAEVLRDCLGEELYARLSEEQAETERRVRRISLVGEVVEKPTPCEPVVPVRTESGRVTYPYEQLRTDVAWPPGVGAEDREELLSDEDFDRLFGMSRTAFRKLPPWKRSNLKKKVDLW
ncbi:hypothetical protein AB1Y20_003875 [Prymnesium parvum]|uniref:HP domain-containing protein n=1 Tax=Prymnesium parvum TaxID=97485 RepID=A0AB34J5Y4_PRYPA